MNEKVEAEFNYLMVLSFSLCYFHIAFISINGFKKNIYLQTQIKQRERAALEIVARKLEFNAFY